jgi:DegV family protein with EDD domain
MRGRVRLVTDSSACLTVPLFEHYGIEVVPILLQVGSEEYRGTGDIQPEDVYRAIGEGVPVKSSAPSPLDYLEAIDRTASGPVVVITPATEFTRMNRNATAAAELAGRPVTVLDSRSASAGHGLIVLAAAEAAEAGGSVHQVVSAARSAAARTELVAYLETLDFLRQSGRVPALALGLADHLGVRPVFRMRNGQAERVALPRSTEAAQARIVKLWRAEGGKEAAWSAVFHAARPQLAERLVRALGGAAFVTEFNAAMGIHTGPGVVGVAWVRRLSSAGGTGEDGGPLLRL